LARQEITKPETLSLGKTNMMPQATAWLLELGLLDNPNIKETLILNILKVNDAIKDTQLLIDMNENKMLVFIKLGFWSRVLKRREICSDILDMIASALPSYEFRITLDPELFNKALEGFKKSSKQLQPK
jgi:hypothetical protein